MADTTTLMISKITKLMNPGRTYSFPPNLHIYDESHSVVLPIDANCYGKIIPDPSTLAVWMTFLAKLCGLSRGRSAVNLNKMYVPSLDAPSSTFIGRPLPTDPFDGGLAKSKDSRKCGTCSFLPACV
jgi:hypothetical protein